MVMDLKLSMIPPGAVPQLWGLGVEEMVERVIAKDPNSPLDKYDVLSGLLVGALQLWVLSEPTDGSTNIRAMSVTQVVMYPQCRHAEIIMASGDDPEKWLEFEDDFVAGAKGQGCDRMRIQTPRRGLAKVLPHWDQTAIIMERTI